jgi:hypothetical protein
MNEASALIFELVPGKEGVREGRQCVRLLSRYERDGIVVPKHFVSDWASVPGLLDGIVPAFGPYAPAAVLHDWLYATAGLFGYFTRAECDRIFLDLMAELGVPWWKRSLMYRAVRLGGGSGFGSPD